MPDKIDFSIIIPNLHSPMVDQTIESVLAQKTDRPFEIIVVGMDKWDLVEKYSQVKFIKTEKPTPPGIARNIGVSLAVGDYLYFIDSDCIASPEWITNHFNNHQNENRLIIIGGGVDFPMKNYFTLAENVSSFHEFMIHHKKSYRKYLPSLNLSLSKKAWEIIGVFNNNISSEDIDFTLRAYKNNIDLLFDPLSSIQHLPNRRNIKILLSRSFTSGYHSVRADIKYSKELKTPFVLKSSFLCLISSPFLAVSVILKMIIIEKLPFKYWHTLPFVMLMKIAWCFGYAKQLYKKGIYENKKL